MKPTTYYVWRRNDGFVNSSANLMPNGFTGANGSVTTFEQLGHFDNWGDAYDCIVEARKGEPKCN